MSWQNQTSQEGMEPFLHILKHSCLRIDKEENELLKRQKDANARSRSRSSSASKWGRRWGVFPLHFAESGVVNINCGSWQSLAPLSLREVYRGLATPSNFTYRSPNLWLNQRFAVVLGISSSVFFGGWNTYTPARFDTPSCCLNGSPVNGIQHGIQKT